MARKKTSLRQKSLNAEKRHQRRDEYYQKKKMKSNEDKRSDCDGMD